MKEVEMLKVSMLLLCIFSFEASAINNREGMNVNKPVAGCCDNALTGNNVPSGKTDAHSGETKSVNEKNTDSGNTNTPPETKP